MTIPPPIHRWSMSAKAAIRLQKHLAGRVRIERLARRIRLVAGFDLAFSPDGERCLAGVVVYDLKTHSVIEEKLAWRPVRFPYIPGLLSFRETPAALAAARKLEHEPEVFIFDGHGLAHPRRLGLACHAALLMDRPAIGCAKSRLCGTHDEPPAEPGEFTPLTHRGETVGVVLRTRAKVKPVFVSVGHRVTLATAVRIVTACVTRYRLPEPTRLAHMLVTRCRCDG